MQNENMKIAKILGFKFTYNQGGIPVQVSYPEKYVGFMYEMPTARIPDFTKIIDEYITFVKTHSIIPKMTVPKKRGTKVSKT